MFESMCFIHQKADGRDLFFYVPPYIGSMTTFSRIEDYLNCLNDAPLSTFDLPEACENIHDIGDDREGICLIPHIATKYVYFIRMTGGTTQFSITRMAWKTYEYEYMNCIHEWVTPIRFLDDLNYLAFSTREAATVALLKLLYE